MAVTIPQLPCCVGRSSPTHSEVSGEPLWIDSWGTHSLIHGELKVCGFAGEPGYGTHQINSFVASLRACTRNKDLARGTSIHHDLVQRQLVEECSDALVTMYAKCGELGKAKTLLDMHNSKDVITWSALIAGYSRQGLGHCALDCLEQMQHEGILPDAVTFVSALKACATIKAADRGKQIHDQIARQGLLQNDVILGGALVNMYAKCGAASEAQRVLKELPTRNVVSWSALIAGYAEEGQAEQALNCLEEMQHEGIVPNAVTYVCALRACAILRAADRGKRIHDKIRRQGLLQKDIMLGNALIDMYAKCSNVSEAWRVLQELPSRDVVSWNALITGYVQEGEAEQALKCLEQMQNEGILPNAVTYVGALKACTTIRAIDRGKKIHDEISRQGFLKKSIPLGGALVDMYAKCGDVSEARRVLGELSFQDVVSWNALIGGYAQEGEAEEALNCLEQMQHKGILPDAVTYISALKACAMMKAADRGKQIHDEIARQGLLENNILLSNTLVDMYSKCGDVSEARRVLEELPSRNVVTWNALIAGYAQEGEVEEALNCLERMKYEGILPDAVTCACVLNVCSHRGLVEEGQELFWTMTTKYGVKPSLECYTSMIDLIGRAGHLEKAVRLIQEMPSSNYMGIWHALLGACLKWTDVNVGEWAFEQAVKLDKSDGGAHILMANIYADVGMEEKAKHIEALRIRNSAWKKPGYSG
ncbi:hypothetical protein GOP47_0009957 [Adiantum capillus-veneris]|uniref:Pentatricopeptide repeat-containing protein n=1 Tax=Adiantum capillus-veneris TaxID=13818 RepID=A0A9D4ZJZ5_ADICA|nr:hypothetical protein GOP47_0009957 [Adiantum capillus-veneris]